MPTRWSPDTCGCVLDYNLGSGGGGQQSPPTLSELIQACPVHSSINNAETTFNTVLEENTRKNQALGKALETNPELADFVDGKTGKRYDFLTIKKQIKSLGPPPKIAEELGGALSLKPEVTYNWKWSEGEFPRTLEISFNNIPVPKITAQTKSLTVSKLQKSTELQQILDLEFSPEKGRGKVKIL